MGVKTWWIGSPREFAHPFEPLNTLYRIIKVVNSTANNLDDQYSLWVDTWCVSQNFNPVYIERLLQLFEHWCETVSLVLAWSPNFSM